MSDVTITNDITGAEGFLKQGSGYYVYANAADNVGGSGLASVTADVSTLTTSATAVALPACSSGCTVGTTTYAFKSALQTADGSLSEGAKSYTVTATDNVALTGDKLGSATVDNTKPLISASATKADTSAYVANTWTNQDVTVSFSCADTGAVQSGLGANTVGGGGTQSAETSTGSFTNTGACADNAGNAADANTFSPIKVDKTAPANGLSLVNQTTQTAPDGTAHATSYLSGSTLFYDENPGGSGGSFKFQNTVTDALSGSVSSTFGGLGGTTANWTFTGSTVSGSSPYLSNTASWANNTTSSPTETVTATDAAGNTNTGTTLTFAKDRDAVAPTFTFPVDNGGYQTAAWDAGGTTPCGASGTICGTVDDGAAASGVKLVQVSVKGKSGSVNNKFWTGTGFTSSTDVFLPAALVPATGTSFTWSLALPASALIDAEYEIKAYLIDNVGNDKLTKVNVFIDNVAPVSSLSVTAPNANGWNKANVAPELSATDSGSGASGVATKYWAYTGAQTTSGSGSGGGILTLTTISVEGTTTITYHAVDAAGNVEADQVYTFKLDKTLPTNSLTLGSANGAYMAAANGTLFYKSNAAGSFTLVNAVADGGSGAGSATFPAITASNWTHGTETVSTPSGGPFTSSTYSWTATAGAPSSGQRTFTSADAAGNASTGTVLTVHRRQHRADRRRADRQRHGGEQLARKHEHQLDRELHAQPYRLLLGHRWLRLQHERAHPRAGLLLFRRLRQLRRPVHDHRRAGGVRARRRLLPVHTDRHRSRR